MAPYRPPGRSNRSGRTNADNDVFEGLPVKQWGQSYARVSLEVPVAEVVNQEDEKWGEPPMPRDSHLLNAWTQQLLRLARSGKIGIKRKHDADAADEEKPEDENAEEGKNDKNEDRGYLAKKWKPVPEHLLEPEHKHFEFLAKRRKGLPSFYGGEQLGGPLTMRKTKVQKADVNGEISVYEVLVPEGQSLEGEVTESAQLADLKPVQAAPGTIIEGVGVANDEGVVVAEHLRPLNAPRRNRPPPKKKGGPGRGKKRVTFTNPDGTTYTKVVPNATKIVPEPGQIIKHVAKGEEATADISAEQAAAANVGNAEDGGDDEGSGSEGEEDDDSDREDGELSEDDAPTGDATPHAPESNDEMQVETIIAPPEAQEDVVMEEAPAVEEITEPTAAANAAPAVTEEEVKMEADAAVAAGIPPEQPTITEEPTAPIEPPQADPTPAEPKEEPGPEPAVDNVTTETAEVAEPVEIATTTEIVEPAPAEIAAVATEEPAKAEPEVEKFEDGDEDLLGNLEKHLGNEEA